MDQQKAIVFYPTGWKGYRDSENTWESAENLTNAHPIDKKGLSASWQSPCIE